MNPDQYSGLAQFNRMDIREPRDDANEITTALGFLVTAYSAAPGHNGMAATSAAIREEIDKQVRQPKDAASTRGTPPIGRFLSRIGCFQEAFPDPHWHSLPRSEGVWGREPGSVVP